MDTKLARLGNSIAGKHDVSERRDRARYVLLSRLRPPRRFQQAPERGRATEREKSEERQKLSSLHSEKFHAFTLRMSVFLQPKRQRDEQHAYDHGISADYPDQRQRARTRSQHHADSKQHRYYAAQNQEPLVVDLLAQLDRAYDLKYPGRDRPAGNEKQKHERAEAGHQEGQQPCRDPKQTDDSQPPTWPRRATGNGGNDREHTVNQRKRAVEQN